MIIFLAANPTFTGELYKTHFENGISLEHVNQHTFDMIRDVLGLEPNVIQTENECESCHELKAKIRDLELEIVALKIEKKVKK